MRDKTELGTLGGVGVSEGDELDVGGVGVTSFPEGHWGLGPLGLDEGEVVRGARVSEVVEGFGVDNPLRDWIASMM